MSKILFKEENTQGNHVQQRVPFYEQPLSVPDYSDVIYWRLIDICIWSPYLAQNIDCKSVAYKSEKMF